jgi:hypothetical protein
MSNHLARLICLFVVVSVTVSLAGPIQIAPKAVTFMGYDTPGTIQNHINYTFDGNGWTNDNNPLAFVDASALSALGLENPYFQTLSNFGGGWTFVFNTTAVIADNTFKIQTYDVQGPTPPATNADAFALAAPKLPFKQNCIDNNDCVGNELQLAYSASGDDPPANATLHWIQVLDNNLRDAGSFRIDNPGSSSPYYYDKSPAGPAGYLDIPSNNDAGTPHFFNAQLYLVTGPAANNPGQVTIYGALDWGWHNDPVPEPGTVLLCLVSLAAIRRVRTAGCPWSSADPAK